MKLSASHFLLQLQIKNSILQVDPVQLVLKFRNSKDLAKRAIEVTWTLAGLIYTSLINRT